MADFNALNAEVADLSERVTAVEELTHTMRDKILGGDEAERAWWWREMTQDECRDAWAKVTDFVDNTLIGWYEETLFECWFMHPRALDILTAMYRCWDGNYLTSSAGWGPIEFQEKWYDDALKHVQNLLNHCAHPDGYCHKYKDRPRKIERANYIATNIRFLAPGVERPKERKSHE